VNFLTMNFGLEHPALLAAGLVFLFLTIPLSRLLRNPFALVLPLGPPGGVPFRPPFTIEFLIKFLRFLDYLAALLLVAAASGPVLKNTEITWLSRGADILFVVDTSPSMAGIDMGGRNRFDTARELIRSFAEGRLSDAIGLAAVGSDAALLVPPATDRRALFSRLDSLQIGELGDGTALGLGLSLAALHLRNSGAPRRVVVLITDGENNAGSVHPETAASLYPALDISLWVIGVGRSGEVPIDYIDPVTKVRRTGTFDSRFDPENLGLISKAGEGTYVAAPSAAAFTAAFERLDAGEMVVRRSVTQTKARPWDLPFIAAALFFIVLAAFIRYVLLGAWVPGEIRHRLSLVFFIAALICIGAAFANPRWGSRYVEEYYRGVDAVFAIDVSRSMEVEDMKREGAAEVSRLERGLDISLGAVAACSGLRFGAALGRGRALAAVPLTWDKEAVFGFLEGLNNFSLTGTGTNLEALVDAAADAFETGFPNRRVIVLVSDGEALSGALDKALDRAVEAGIRIVPLALGTEEGGAVPPAAGEDAPVISRRRSAALQYAAVHTGGFFVDGNSAGAVKQLSLYLMSLAPESGKGSGRRELKSRRDLFVIIALLAFGASKLCLLSGKRKGVKREA
jgi:Ca-activated chloride channel family protein